MYMIVMTLTVVMEKNSVNYIIGYIKKRIFRRNYIHVLKSKTNVITL